MKKKIKQNRIKKKREQNHLDLPVKPTWWPNRTGPAQPSPPFSCRLPPLAPKLLGGERWRCPGHLLLPPVSLATPRRRLVSPRSSSSLAAPSLFPEHSPPPLFSSPNAPAAADENHRGHGPSLVPLSSPGAPSRHPRPPHQAKPRRTPCDDASELVTAASAAGLRPSVCIAQSLPELNDGAVRIPVSPAVISPSPHGRFLAATPMTASPVCRRRTRSSPTRLR